MRRSRLILGAAALLCAVWLLAWPAVGKDVHAQDILATATPPLTPTVDATASGTPPVTPPPLAPIRFERADAEVLFPAAIRVSLYLLGKVRQVADIQLTLVREDTGAVLVSTNQTRSAYEYIDGRLLTTYLFPIPPDGTSFPAPFTTLRYRWEVRDQDGKTLTESKTFVYGDSRPADATPGVWQSAGEPPLQIFSHNPELTVEFLRIGAERAYTRLKSDFGLNRDYRIVLYDPESDFCKRSQEGRFYIDSRYIGGIDLPCDPNVAAAIYRRYGFTLLRRPNTLLTDTQARIVEMLVSDTLDAMWTPERRIVPAWLRQGLIEFYALGARPTALGLVQEAARTDSLFTYAQMEAPPPDDFARANLWRAQAYTLTIYMADHYGARTPANAARALRDGFRWDEYLAMLLNTGAQTLYNDWRSWLFTEAAEQAVRWSPYLETTATPSATPTRIPSITPTSTAPTATPTITATFLGLATITVTPSNTPRPPGSLNTPTPRPSSGSGEAGDEDSSSDGGSRDGKGSQPASPLGIVLIVASVVVILAIVGFVLVRRNRK